MQSGLSIRARAAIFAATLLIPIRVLADELPETPAEVRPMPTLHMRLGTGDGTLRGPDGKDYAIPQGSHVLAPEAWSTLDAELVRLQEQETRLAAENKSFRTSADEFRPGWIVVVTSLAAGLVGGAYLAHKYWD